MMMNIITGIFNVNQNLLFYRFHNRLFMRSKNLFELINICMKCD